MAGDSGSGSGTGTRTVYVDTTVFTSGPSHTVITRREKRGSTLYIYRTIYKHYVPPASSAANPAGYAGSGGKHKDGQWVPTNSGNNAWVITRQRLLRALGFNVAVDGVWGAASQTAWNRYLNRSNSSYGSAAAETRDLHRIEAFKARQQRATAAAQAAMKQAQYRMELAHKKDVSSKAIIDPDAHRLDAIEQARTKDAKQYQEGTHIAQWKQGAEQQTYVDARMRDYLRQDPTRARNFSIRTAMGFLSQDDFDPTDENDVRVIQNYLKANGFKDLNVNGEWGSETNDALLEAYADAKEAEEREAHRMVVDTFYGSGILVAGQPAPWWWPTGGKTPTPGELIKLLNQGSFTASLIFRELMRQAKQPTVQFAMWRQQQIEEMHETFFGSKPGYDFFERVMPAGQGIKIAEILLYPGLSDQARNQLSSSIGSMIQSSTANEFRNSLLLFQTMQQQALEDEAKKGFFDRVAHGEFWSMVFDGLSAGAHFLQKDVVYGFFHDINDIIDGEYDWNKSEAEWRRYQAELDADYKKWEDDLNVVERLAWEIVVDPLNLVPFGKAFGLAGKGLRTTGWGLEHMGVKLSMEGSDFGLQLVTVGRAIRTLPETKSYLANYSRRVIAAARYTDEMSGVGDKLLADIFNGMALATRLKGEAMQAAQRSVEWSARHAFRIVDTEGGPDAFKNVKYLPQVEGTGNDLMMRMGTEFPELNNSLLSSNASFYYDKGRRYLSNVGRSVKARMFEEIRVQQIQRTAYASAAKARRAYLVMHGGDQAARKVARTKFQERYDEVIAMFGSHLEASDLENLGLVVATKFRTRMLQQRWLNANFNRWQDFLERQAELGDDALGLWDDTDRWIAREGEEALLLREQALKGFDETIEMKNPMYHQEVDLATMRKMRDDEIWRVTGRIKDYAEGENFAGRAVFQGDSLEKRLKVETDKVKNAWKDVPGKPGMYWDDREFIRVSPLYARQIKALSGEDDWKELADIARVSGKPIHATDKTLDGNFAKMAWMMEPPRRPIKDEDLFVDPVMRNAPRASAGGKNETFARLSEDHETWLMRASDSALSRALGKQFAFAAAMHQSQNRLNRGLDNLVFGSMQTWVFLSLPLRMGWVVRNVIDNQVKALIHGALDPRHYISDGGYLHRGAKHVDSVIESGIRQARHAAYWLDEMFGTNTAAYYDAVLETFWQHSRDVIKKIFDGYLIPVPESALDGAQLFPYKRARPVSQIGAKARAAINEGDEHARSFLTDEELTREFNRMYPKGYKDAIQSFKDAAWDLFATRPENFHKRALYRSTYAKAIKAGKSEEEAFIAAVKKIEEVLFNYDKVTVLEENFKVFWPFIDFWRKNTTFWVKASVRHPQLPWAIHNYQQTASDIHDDWPDWMRRYWKVTLPFSDVLTKVPGLDWFGKMIGNQEVYFDPLNSFSFAPLYRAFKDENPLLPPEDQGIRFLAPFADAVEQWGLGFNPFFSRPMQDLGWFNYKSWQTVFPETSWMAAFTRKYISDRWADRIIDFDSWLGDPLFKLMGQARDASAEMDEDINVWVQMEMANQRAKGEPVSRERAMEKIQDYYLVQTLTGFFTGFYVRRMTPEDIYLYQMQEAMALGFKDYDEFTEQQQAAYQLFKRRKWDPLEYDRYLEMMPLIQGYYNQTSWEEGEEYLREHPELVPLVNPYYKGTAYTYDNTKNLGLVMDSQTAFQMFDLIDALDLDPEVYKLAEKMLVTPELQRFWDEGDTPLEHRRKVMQGEYFRYVEEMQKGFFAIPESDFEARQGYLAEHPTLERWWAVNNSDSDDYKAIMNSVNADLREMYFEIMGDGPDPDWDAAHKFLQQFPFIFEFTTAATKVDPVTGEWIGSGFDKGQHAADYARAKRYLNIYFGLPPSERAAWLNSDAPGAAIVRAYFAKYASNVAGRGGMTQHAQDYLAAKDELDYYFSLPEDKRSAWLESSDPRAAVVLAYFKKYGKTHEQTRAWENIAGLGSRNAELNRRMAFWKHYFSLPPDKRPAYIYAQAENHGIFVFGMHGAKQRHDSMMAYMRNAMAHGASARAAAYMWVKPMLDVFFSLKRKDRELFVRANPELEWYFDNYADTKSATGDPKLDGLLEKYFNLPQGSQERSLFLQKHPEIQDYFDSIATPAERAMHNLLEVYFNIPVGPERKEFLLKHPEISEYFDRKQDEAAQESAQLMPFELADPRMQKYIESSASIISGGQRQAQKLAYQSVEDYALEYRTKRRLQEEL